MPAAFIVAALAFAPATPLLPSGHRVRTASVRLDAGLAAVAGDLWQNYNVALVASPLTTKAITAGVIIGSADATAQLVESRGATFDIVRALRWAVFGLVLQGPWNHFFYLYLDQALPPTPTPFTATTLAKVGIDQFVQAPIFTMIILVFFAVVEGKGLGYAKTQIQNDLGGILIKNWSIFVPATVINISFCPPELRVLFLNCVFFGWVIYLSLFLNEDAEAEEGL